MHHAIKIPSMHFDLVHRGLLTFWIVNSLEVDVQVGQLVCFENDSDTNHLEASVLYVTNRHQHINHIVFGFRVVNLSDSERMSISMVNYQLSAELQQPKHIRARCSSQEDYERKIEILGIIQRNKTDRMQLRTKKHIQELNNELQDIENRFLKGQQQ